MSPRQRVVDALDALRQHRENENARPAQLFDVEARRIADRETQRETERAIARVARHAGEPWKRAALQAVERTAEQLDRFTVIDVWQRLNADEPYDRRSVGWAMKEAGRRGWAAPTGDYRRGPASTHARPLLVWASRLREEPF